MDMFSYILGMEDGTGTGGPSSGPTQITLQPGWQGTTIYNSTITAKQFVDYMEGEYGAGCIERVSTIIGGVGALDYIPGTTPETAPGNFAMKWDEGTFLEGMAVIVKNATALTLVYPYTAVLE